MQLGNTVLQGRYRIIEHIGRGGMGVVYLAEHQTLRRRAALKIIVPELAENKDFRERFLREARIAAALDHPSVVTIYDGSKEIATATLTEADNGRATIALPIRPKTRLLMAPPLLPISPLWPDIPFRTRGWPRR